MYSPKLVKQKSLLKRLSSRHSLTTDSAPSASEDNRKLPIKNIIGVKIKRQRNATQREGQGVCLGVALFTYEEKRSGKFSSNIVLLGHPSQDVCLTWIEAIQARLADFSERPRSAKLYIQKDADNNGIEARFNDTVKPLLESAGIGFTTSVISHKEFVQQDMRSCDLSDIDCVIAVGGDVTARSVADALLCKRQENENILLRPGFSPVRSQIPLGIIPFGKTNHIVNSVQGVEDSITACIHIILGNLQPVDICSVFVDDRFLCWAFHCHYGYFSEVLPYAFRYAALRAKSIDAAFVKALTKSKFRSYECDILYLPDNTANNSNDSETSMCRRGCDVCGDGRGRLASQYSDEIEEFDPLQSSINSTYSTQANNLPSSEESNWKSMKTSIFNVSLLALPALCPQAPLGINKFTHLADGVLDLVITKETDKKQFIRFLRRHGNKKNQLNFPFVEHHRCTEVKFLFRKPDSWNLNDELTGDRDDRLRLAPSPEPAGYGGRVERSQSMHDVMRVIDELSDSDCSEADSTAAQRCTTQQESVPATENSHLNNQEQTKTRRKSLSSFITSKTRKNFKDSNTTLCENPETKQNLVKKNKTVQSHWNIDNDMETEQNLEFRIHSSLLNIYGLGISRELDPDSVNMSCLKMF